MTKRFCIKVLIFQILFMVASNLWCGSGSGDVDYYEFPAPDRIRNVPAVSSIVTGISNDIYISSFGLQPYRISQNLVGIDAWIFRSKIQNGSENWYFQAPNYFIFDGSFESINSDDLPDCGRNAYNNDDSKNMAKIYSQEEINARIDGGTGFWTSPVLVENQEAIILLNKSGVLMCLDSDFTNNNCVRWSFNLRIKERNLDPSSSKFEYMATPIVAGDYIFVSGIYTLFKIDISNFNNPTLAQDDYIQLIYDFNSDDHLINPITYDLEDEPNTNYLCVSKKGDFTIVDSDLNIQTEFIISNSEIHSRPLVDADGQVYIAANNGEIFYFPQLLTSSSATLPDNENELIQIDCGDQSYRTSLITDGSHNIYALTDNNDILKLKEVYDFTYDEPLFYPLDQGNLTEFEYIYDDDYYNFKAINNHSVLFEKPELDLSCLTSIYNDDVIYNNEEYYNNADPSSNQIFVRLFAINNFSETGEYASFHEPLDNTSTYGGLAPYQTSGGKNNLIWCDENGYAWTWVEFMPSHYVDFSPDASSPLISAKSNPKFMKDLTNQPTYDKADITVNVHGLETIDAEKIFLNSYLRDTVEPGDYFSASFNDILKHKNYTLGIRLSEGDPIIYEEIIIDNQSIINLNIGTLTISYGENEIIDDDYQIYENIIIEPGGILTIDDSSNVNVLGEVTLYNEGQIKILNDSQLIVSGALVNDQDDGETGEAVITTTELFSSNGYFEANTVIIEEDGILRMQAIGYNEYKINNTIIDGTCTLTTTISLYTNSFNYCNIVVVNGVFNIYAISKFQYGTEINLDNQSELNISTVDIGEFRNCELNILSGSECNIEIDNIVTSVDFINSSITIDNQSVTDATSKLNLSSCTINLDNSNIDVLDGAELNFITGNDNVILNLINRSSVNIDGINTLGKPSKLFIDWGSEIYGSVSTSYDPDPIPGDRIECTDGGLITTGNIQAYENYITYPNVPEIIFSKYTSTETLWDGILITDPINTVDNEYWFVNCDIEHINKLSFEGNGNEDEAKLNLYKTDFHNSGQILVRDGHILTIDGEPGIDNGCHIYNNLVYPISVYYSTVDIIYAEIGGTQFEGNYGGGIYMYGSASQISTITNSKFSFNNGEGVKLNGPDISFLNNDISFNSGFGMIAYDPTQFIGVGNFFNNFEDNGFAEYAGMHNTFNLEFARNFYTETNFGVGADQYFLMNLNWDGLNGIVIEEDVFNGGQADLDNLYPYDNPSAWVGEAPVRQERLLLQNAMNDFSNQDYLSAEATLLLIIEDYPLSVEASSAVYYLFHIVSLTNQNYDDFINFLENLSVNTSTPLYKNIETIITKSYIKNEDYISAIERLEDIINNSEIVDEIILAMIDEGYCYMKIAENGYRNLPEKCTIKTRDIDEYQKKVRELESGFTFYPKVDNNPIVEKVILNNNYPNPFNPTTTISFSIPYDTNVFITVYNIKGQKIRKILEGNFEKGNHSVIWDGTDSNNKAVSSGIYFYKLETNNDALMKKMLLLK